MENKKDLIRETLRIAWPAVLESFFVALAGMIDTYMVSSLGTYAVASVGLTTQPKYLALSLFFSTNIAVSALVARRRGQKDRKNANEVVCTALLFTILSCLIISLITFIGADTIIDWCGSNQDTHLPAVEYFHIIQAGMIFSVLSLVINAAQRGSGNTRIAMTTNIVSSLVNICFNYLLITGKCGFPRMELRGAAIATVLGTIAACILSILSLFKKDSFVSLPYIFETRIRPTFSTLKTMLSLSINFLLENIAMRVGFMYTAVIAAKLGTEAFAAHNVGMNFLSLAFSFGDGMQVAAVALIGRSLGEDRPDKAKTYGSICQKVGFTISCILAAILLFFGKELFGFFFSDPETLEIGITISRYIIVIVLFQISQVIYGGCLRGAGDVRYTLFSSLLSVTLIRTAVTWLLTSVFPLGIAGIWIGVLSDQFSRFVLLSLRFRQGHWTALKI